MPENYYHSLLGVEEEILQPDYYQLLLIDTDREEPTPELVEQKYKAQMAKAQQVRSTKHKDLIEFLKGELRSAKRTLENPQQRKKYDDKRQEEASEKVRDQIITFIQISGNLSDIEVNEIRRQAHILNCPQRLCEQLIDEQLTLFGCKRVKATAAQMKRAGEIMQKRAAHGQLRSSDRLPVVQSASSDDMPDMDTARRNLHQEAEKLQRRAQRQKRYGLVFRLLGLINMLAALITWLLLIAVGLFVLMPDTFRPLIVDNAPAGARLLLYNENVEADQVRTDKETLRTELEGLIADERATVAALRDDRATARDLARQIRDHAADGNTPPEQRLDNVRAYADELLQHLRDAATGVEPLQHVEDLFGSGELDAALTMASNALAAVIEPALALFVRDRLRPEQLAGQPELAWDFCGQSLGDFRHPWMRPGPDGLEIAVPAMDDMTAEQRGWLENGEFVWPFGPAWEVGVVDLRGNWVGDPGRIGLGYWSGQPGIDGGQVVLDASQRLLQLEMGGSSDSADLTPSGDQLELTLVVVKFEDPLDKTKLKTRARGIVGGRDATVNPAWSAALASGNGRLALHIPPGTRLRLQSIRSR